MVEAELKKGLPAFHLHKLVYYLGRPHRHQQALIKKRRIVHFSLSRRQYRNTRQWLDRHPESIMDNDLNTLIAVKFRRINKPEHNEQRFFYCSACGLESDYHGARKRCVHCKSITLVLRHRSLIVAA